VMRDFVVETHSVCCLLAGSALMTSYLVKLQYLRPVASMFELISLVTGVNRLGYFPTGEKEQDKKRFPSVGVTPRTMPPGDRWPGPDRSFLSASEIMGEGLCVKVSP